MKASSIVKQNILYPSYILFYEDYKNPPMEKFVRNGKVSAVGLSRIARTKLCLALHRGEQWQAPHAWKTEDNTRGVSIVSTTVHPCVRVLPFPRPGHSPGVVIAISGIGFGEKLYPRARKHRTCVIETKAS